jgi:hypothetical protein
VRVKRTRLNPDRRGISAPHLCGPRVCVSKQSIPRLNGRSQISGWPCAGQQRLGTSVRLGRVHLSVEKDGHKTPDSLAKTSRSNVVGSASPAETTATRLMLVLLGVAGNFWVPLLRDAPLLAPVASDITGMPVGPASEGPEERANCTLGLSTSAGFACPALVTLVRDVRTVTVCVENRRLSGTDWGCPPSFPARCSFRPIWLAWVSTQMTKPPCLASPPSVRVPRDFRGSAEREDEPQEARSPGGASPTTDPRRVGLPGASASWNAACTRRVTRRASAEVDKVVTSPVESLGIAKLTEERALGILPLEIQSQVFLAHPASLLVRLRCTKRLQL